MTMFRRLYGVSILVGALVLLLGVGQAQATMPWWHVNTISAPMAGVSGESMVVLEVSNLGDAAVDGFEHPVTIADLLPAGVIPKQVHGEGGGSFPIGIDSLKEDFDCSLAGQLVSCTYDGPLLAYERFMVEIGVEVIQGDGSGTSEVAVTGGGAPALVWQGKLGLESGKSFGPEEYEVDPEEEGGSIDTQAGSHPFQLTTTLTFKTQAVPVNNPEHKKEPSPELQPVGLTKDARFDLPPGFVGNPTPLPKCPLSVFVKLSTEVRCPDNTVVGVATPIITNTALGPYVPLAVTVPIYILEPAIGEPARFGFSTQLGPVVLDTSVKTGGDYSVVVSVPNVPSDLGLVGSQVTFWGVPADPRHDMSRGQCLDEYEGDMHKAKRFEFLCPVQEKPQPFLTMPTSCAGPLRTSVQADSWEEAGRFAAPKESFFSSGTIIPTGLDGCNQLSFEPSISVTANGEEGSTPTGLTVGVHVNQEASLNPEGLAQASVKDTTVALPAGVGLNPSGADGLSACSLSQIALESPSEQTCPESAKIGTVEIKTPLLPNPLVGAAYLATQEENPFGSLIALYIVARDPISGVLLKVAGEVKPQEGTGQLVSTFKETPQLPFEDLHINFFGGSRAPLGTPALCGSYVTQASIAPWSGNAPAQISSSPFQITSGPGGTPCLDPLRFAPSLTAGSLNIQAGAFTPFTTTMSREDGNQNLQAVQLRMPPGLSGILTGVPLCAEAQANAGTCGPESLIGETTVSVGLGSNPYSVKGGRVYITGPYEGAPFGLSIVNPAKAGPFDLEKNTPCDCVVVRAKIEVDPTTTALTITTDSAGPYKIPQMIDGIPLQIKHVNVIIDRQGFTFNPTDCRPLKITGSLVSTEGVVSSLNVPLQVTNCATLGFKPSFSVTTSGHTSRAKGASLHVKLSYPKLRFGSQANIASVKVSLPKRLPSRLTTLQKACPARIFEQNPAACPRDSRVGTARASTPLLPVELNGPAYFVSHGGAKFPELIVVLSGYGVTVDLHGETFINEKTNVTSSIFRTVPDVPVGTFELNLPEGPNSALAATANLCASELKMPTAFKAQNGMEIHRSTSIGVTGCHKTKRKLNRKRTEREK